MTTMNEYSNELRELHEYLSRRFPSIAGRLLIIADAIDAHLAKGAQMPDAINPFESQPEGLNYADGWNACRQAMLSQRGEG